MKHNEILVLTFKLFIITAFTALLLGGAYEITKGPIERQIVKANSDAMKEILPMADSFKMVEKAFNSDILKEVNEAYSGSALVGYAIKVSPKGYGGTMEIMVGISKEGKVEGIKILSQSETPGLGANALLPAFYLQYKGRAIDDELTVVKTTPSKDHEIQAITGATMTSKAVTDGVNEAIKIYKNQLEGGQK